MMHTKITATGLPEVVRLSLLDQRNNLDELSQSIENASELMWVLSGNDDISAALSQTFRALESMTKRFSIEAKDISDKLTAISSDPDHRVT